MPASNNKDKLERKIVKRFRKALSDYRLIEDGDKILVGLSGGKDSLCLLEMLGRRAMINKPEFSVEAIHIKIENINYESDTAYRHVFSVRGTDAKQYSDLPKNQDATRLLSAIIWTTSYTLR